MMTSALLVFVPEAEPVVGGRRATLDAAAAKGVPAHVTVLAPFVAAGLIDDALLAGVRETVGGVSRFSAELARVAWFGDRVVYLAPEPAEPFRALTAALWRRFPGCPPYRGEFAEVVPHLTVGHDAPPAVLEAAAAEVVALLPVRFEVVSVRLMVGDDGPGSWETVAEFPLADR
jgi:2'-5' RNA ligase